VLGLTDLRVGGRRVADDEILVAVDAVRLGARIADGEKQPDPLVTQTDDHPDARPAILEYSVVTGPDCCDWKSLSVGRHLVGRSPIASIHIQDVLLEHHHGIVDVGDSGSIDFTQLSGLRAVRLEGRPVGLHEPVPLGHRLQLGATTLVFRAVGSADRGDVRSRSEIVRHPSDPWRRIVRRAPPTPAEAPGAGFVVPAPPVEERWPTATGLIGAGVAGVGAGVIATVMGNAWFALFGLVGAAGAVATWLVAVAGVARRRRRDRRSHRRALDRFERSMFEAAEVRRATHARSNPSIGDVLAVACETTRGDRLPRAGLWSRRLGDDRALRVVIGRGTERWAPDVVASDGHPPSIEPVHRLDAMAATVEFAPGDSLAAAGAESLTRSLVRSLIVQLATWWGPADWRLVVITRDPGSWEWAGWLPHNEHQVVIDPTEVDATLDASVGFSPSASSSRSIVANSSTSTTAIPGADRVTVLVSDDPGLLTMRTGSVRRFIARTNAVTIALVGVDAVVPSFCRRTLTIGPTGCCQLFGEIAGVGQLDGIVLTGISAKTAGTIASRLAPLADPELESRRGSLPTSVRLAELDDDVQTPQHVIARWRASGRDPAPTTPIGRSVDGTIEIDLVRDGPHGLIAGTTGSGKSELLRTLVVGLAARFPPTAVSFVLVDYKGGSTFDACAELPHTVGLVTDLDEGLAARALGSLRAELRRRERLLRAVGAVDLGDYRRHVDVEPVARLVLVIDEFAALAQELPDFLDSLVGIAQRGRSLGVHLLLATQRPAGVVSDAIRANTNLRLALRLHDRSDALDVVGDESPVRLPRRRPGAAVLRLGPDELIELQTATCTQPLVEVTTDIEVVGVGLPTTEGDRPARPSELRQTCDAVIEAATSSGWDAPHRPWIEPLPTELTADEVAQEIGTTALGLVDDPDGQCRRALDWTPDDGSLALVGSYRSGTTTTLMAIAARMCTGAPSSRHHLYVVDARGDDRWAAFDGLAHCGGIVAPGETERLRRLLLRLAADIDARIGRGRNEGWPRISVIVDGLAATFDALDAVDGGEMRSLLRRVLVDGPGVGVVSIFSDHIPSAHPASDRWIFHLDDPGVMSGFEVPGPIPGRLRIASSGLEAQVAVGLAGLAELPDRPDGDEGPEPVRVLPVSIGVAELPRLGPRLGSSRTDPGSCPVTIGLDSDDFGRAVLYVGASDHVIVLGDPGSGVSTAVRRCAAGLAATRGGVRVIEMLGDELPDEDQLGDTRPAILSIDDAHRIDDPTGLLERIVLGRVPGTTIVAGGRLVAVRSAYGHWTRELTQLRCGLIMTASAHVDGDVFGVVLPRYPLVAPRPGLAWVVDRDRLRLAQVARNCHG